MPRNWRLALALAVLAAGAWGVYLLGPARSTPPHPQRGAAAKTEAERASTASAPPASATDARQVDAGQAATGEPRPPGLAERSAAAQGLDEEPLSLDPAVMRAQRRFARERRDENWALKREAVVKSTFERLEIQEGSFDGVECRSRTCKVSFTFADEDGHTRNTRVFQEGRRVLGPRLHYSRRTLPDGRLRYVMWGARQ